ncbi:MAG TPA: ATP-dependent DNA helicase RecG [Solirubrobacteraceae bacterium]|nr:ATP-dependent DNA helicase RecG [Solirubrobacteraceae bacterium]
MPVASEPQASPAPAEPAPSGRPGRAQPAFASTRALSRGELTRAPVRWPRPSRLDAPLQLPAKRVAAGMATLGVHTVGALLEHLPSDRREARTIAALAVGEQATLAVQVRSIAARPVRRRGMRALVEASVSDATGAMRATFFNQPWLVERYPPGTDLLLHGKLDARGRFSVAHHALGVGPAAAAATGRSEAVAHYPAADGVSSTQILTLVHGARAALADVLEALPAATRARERLPDRASALAAMHFPRTSADPEQGRRRLAFEELLLSQLAFLRRRSARRARTGAAALGGGDTLAERWLAGGLPFALTRDQRRVIAQIAGDLRGRAPMQRLLMGEVGSGKTVVALYALLRAVAHGHQGALMAPTETLAEQHFATIQGLLGGEPVSAALLTGATPARRRRDTLGKLASGELSLIVGTHALIEPDVSFAALAVAVIDEQHRFGVRQRAALEDPAGARAAGDASARGGGLVPHTLHMTATPIPRTLALARYGDLDTSALRELPGDRQPIETRLVSGERERAQAYAELRAQLAAGRQAYVVCPLVEEDEEDPASARRRDVRADGGRQAGELQVRAAKAELSRLRRGELAEHELALLHGGMRASEKQRAMAAFASGQAQVLVATTVIEVGVDVPNATVMLIENAERFGLSQLHQLRGRVGRGRHKASCLLVCASKDAGAGRLDALVRHADGFRLAEIDLAMRKEGELGGTRQSGLGYFRVARLPEDAPLLELARSLAQELLERDPQLRAPEHALLAVALARAHGEAQAAPVPA